MLHPRSGPTLTSTERRESLQFLIFLKQKRNGKIRGRGCADGRKHLDYVTKEEDSSPTIATDAMFFIITIAAKEGRYIANVDI